MYELEKIIYNQSAPLPTQFQPEMTVFCMLDSLVVHGLPAHLS